MQNWFEGSLNQNADTKEQIDLILWTDIAHFQYQPAYG